MTITVKRWMADQKISEMKEYHLLPEMEYTEDAELGKFYVNKETNTVTFIISEVLKETAKAVQVAVKCETDGFRAHDDYRMWLPKSQVVA